MIIGSNLIFIENLPSTNLYAAQILKNQVLAEGTIIQTNYQSSGRGYFGNKWESEDGKNLLISIVLFPSMITPADLFIISIAISLGICDFLKRYIRDCSIKWPNDIYINNDKIAGILIENAVTGNEIEYSIAGIGLNINQQKFLSDAPNPVSMKKITGSDYDLTKCLNQLISDLDRRYKQIISGKYDLLRDEYISNLYRHNKWFDFKDSGGSFTGRILSVSENGRLKIERRSGGFSEYSFKEIDFIP